MFEYTSDDPGLTQVELFILNWAIMYQRGIRLPRESKNVVKLEEFTAPKNKIFRDSQESYQLTIPIGYAIVDQEGDSIHVGSLSAEITKEDGEYKNYCSSEVEGKRRKKP